MSEKTSLTSGECKCVRPNETLFELPTASTTPTPKHKPTGNQVPILDFIRMTCGEVTKAQIVERFHWHYYCHAENYIGAILSRMVKAGMIQRVKNGVFKIPEGDTL